MASPMHYPSRTQSFVSGMPQNGSFSNVRASTGGHSNILQADNPGLVATTLNSSHRVNPTLGHGYYPVVDKSKRNPLYGGELRRRRIHGASTTYSCSASADEAVARARGGVDLDNSSTDDDSRKKKGRSKTKNGNKVVSRSAKESRSTRMVSRASKAKTSRRCCGCAKEESNLPDKYEHKAVSSLRVAPRVVE